MGGKARTEQLFVIIGSLHLFGKQVKFYQFSVEISNRTIKIENIRNYLFEF